MDAISTGATWPEATWTGASTAWMAGAALPWTVSAMSTIAPRPGSAVAGLIAQIPPSNEVARPGVLNSRLSRYSNPNRARFLGFWLLGAGAEQILLITFSIGDSL